jgi:hypothetical protein
MLTPRAYVIAKTDEDSLSKVQKFEEDKGDEYFINFIPRYNRL